MCVAGSKECTALPENHQREFHAQRTTGSCKHPVRQVGNLVRQRELSTLDQGGDECDSTESNHADRPTAPTERNQCAGEQKAERHEEQELLQRRGHCTKLGAVVVRGERRTEQQCHALAQKMRAGVEVEGVPEHCCQHGAVGDHAKRSQHEGPTLGAPVDGPNMRARRRQQARGEQHSQPATKQRAQHIGDIAHAAVHEDLQALEHERKRHRTPECRTCAQTTGSPQRRHRNPDHDIGHDLVERLHAIGRQTAEGQPHHTPRAELVVDLDRVDRQVERQQVVAKEHHHIDPEQTLPRTTLGPIGDPLPKPGGNA